MGDNNGDKQVPSNELRNNIPGIPEKNRSLNPISHKETDIMDPEAKAKNMRKKSIDEVARDIKRKVEKAKKAIDKVTAFISALGPAAPWVILAIVIIIVLVGLWGFFHYMPGLTIGKLKELAQGATDFIQSLFIPDAIAGLKDEDVVNAANYLEEMGYDLIGYGFVEPATELAATDVTYEDVMDLGYNIYDNREDDGKYRYYNEDGEMYDGIYYNSVGVPVDNVTAERAEEEYTDKYGIKRSTEEITSSGKGKIVELSKIKSNLLKTYLLSDYRILTLRNDDQGLLKKGYAALARIFGGFDGAWATGLIKVYHAENGIATDAWGFWDEFLWTSDISIDKEGKTLKIRKGYGNNFTSFKIEGWAARYGLSLEFLLSLHIGTMAPDLVCAVVQNFDTEIQVYLQESGNAEVAAVYVDPDADAEYQTPDKGLTLAYLKEVVAANTDSMFSGMQSNMINGGALAFVNGLAITRTNALWLLQEVKALESPANCLGSAQEYVIVDSTNSQESFLFWDVSSSPFSKYNISDENLDDIEATYENYTVTLPDGEKVKEFNAAHCAETVGSKNDEFLDDEYTWLRDTAEEYDFDESIAEISDIEIEEFNSEGAWTQVGGEYSLRGEYDSYQIKKVKQRRTWYAVVGDGDDAEEVEFEWVTYKFLIYKIGYYETNLADSDDDKFIDIEDQWKETIVWEYIIREKNTQELIKAGILDDDGNYIAKEDRKDLCSDNEDLVAGKDKCCNNCRKYVEKVIAALAEVEDKDYETYTPYIARVVGSWFRDTYFVIPKEPDEAIKDYVKGISGGTSVAIEGSGDEDPEIVDDDADTRKVYLPGHHDSSLYDAYYSESGENELELVVVDSEYLADSGEYWTKYQVDANGDYILYYLNPDGSVSDTTLEEFLNEHSEYTSKEQAEAAGYAFVKKAAVIKATDLETESQGDDDKILWMAYGFDSNGNETGWQKITRADDNNKVNAVYDIKEPTETSGFYLNITMTNTVTQIEDAQRAQTNVTIKNLFKYRKYYIYDGTEERAMLIAKDKEKVVKEVKTLLETKYDDDWASDVAKQLSEYGRSALRQAYGNTWVYDYDYEDDYPWVDQEIVDDINEYIDEYQSNVNNIAEQWLEWQLDMFYSVKDGKGENVYRTNNLLILDEDPRDKDLISTVNIDKSSLNAFSILENTRTLDAEYQYRDFKELIVELDYFDKEDLSDELESVFTWVLPEIDSSGWPIRPWDKQNVDYGALIQSTATYEALGVSTSSSISGNDIVEAAKTLKEYVSGWTYSANHESTDLRQVTTHKTDCSGFVTGVLVEVGYFDSTKTGNREPGALDYWYHGEKEVYKNKTGWEYVSSKLKELEVVSDKSGGKGYVSEDELQPGDILAEAHSEGNDSAGGHVGIYIGDGKIIDFVQSGVRETSFSSSYWTKAFRVPGATFSDASETDVDQEPEQDDVDAEPTTTENETTIAEDKIHFIGDSWFDGLQSLSEVKSKYINAYPTKNAGAVGNVTIEADASAIVIHFGLNGTDKYTETQTLVNKLISQNADIPIFVLAAPHVAKGYSYGAITASDMNANIDEYNKKMKEFCSQTENVTYINPTTNICEDNGNGYLKEQYKMGGGTNDGEFHLNSEGKSVWYKDIISLIQKNGGSSSSSSGDRELAVFKGYSKDNYVVSPVTGKVLEYGTHTRKNVYSGEDEEVEYIIIEVLSEEYFNEDMVADNSQDTEDIDAKSAADGLNLFYKEYDTVCAGYTVMIDGFDVDLSIQDDEGKNGAYEENEVMALYNDGEEDARRAQEEAKLNAPFFVKYDESGELGDSSSFPETYKASTDTKGYYIKEGKYIGKTIESEDVSEPETDDEPIEQDVDDSGEIESSEPYDVIYAGPGDYMRILVKDNDYSVVDNVEDFFDIEDYLYSETTTTTTDDVFVKYLDHYENGAVYDYLFGDASYSDYVSKYITEDKQYFICFGDHVNGNDDRNFGFGILHWLGGSYQAVDYYSQVGIQIDNGTYIDEGVSKCEVEKVLEVQKLEIEAKRELVISCIGETNYNKLTPEQQNCLVDIAYQGCSAENWSILQSLLSSGATKEEVVEKWPRLTSTTWNNQARADARKKLWLEGIYTDSAGNVIN